MTNNTEEIIKEMFDVGAHIGYSKSKRHPSTKKFILQSRQNKDIINLEKTAQSLDRAKEFVKKVKEDDKQILFVGTKAETKRFIREYANFVEMPYVENRWVGGTITNYKEIKERIKLLEVLSKQKDTGELVYKTKKEKLILERKIEKLEKKFGGLIHLDGLPIAIFVVDPEKEYIAVEEAWQKGIPIVALANTDCNISKIDYPIIASDTNILSIEYFIKQIIEVLK